jgi:hypothetical protein
MTKLARVRVFFQVLQHANHANHDKSCNINLPWILDVLGATNSSNPPNPPQISCHPLGHPCWASPRALGCIPSGRVSRDDGVQSPWSPRSSNPAGSAQWKTGGGLPRSSWAIKKGAKKHRNMGSTSRIIMDDMYVYIYIYTYNIDPGKPAAEVSQT